MHTIVYEFDELSPFRVTGGAINCAVYGEATIVILAQDDWWISEIEISCHNEKIGNDCRSWLQDLPTNHPLFDAISVELNRAHGDKINKQINRYIEDCEYFRNAAE